MDGMYFFSPQDRIPVVLVWHHQTFRGNNAILIGVNQGMFLGTVPAGDKAADTETVRGKLGHMVISS